MCKCVNLYVQMKSRQYVNACPECVSLSFIDASNHDRHNWIDWSMLTKIDNCLHRPIRLKVLVPICHFPLISSGRCRRRRLYNCIVGRQLFTNANGTCAFMYRRCRMIHFLEHGFLSFFIYFLLLPLSFDHYCYFNYCFRPPQHYGAPFVEFCSTTYVRGSIGSTIHFIFGSFNQPKYIDVCVCVCVRII